MIGNDGGGAVSFTSGQPHGQGPTAAPLDARRTSRRRSTTTRSRRSTCPTTCAARSRTAAPSACRATRISAAAGAALVAVAAAAAARRRRSTAPAARSPATSRPIRRTPTSSIAGGNNGSFLTRLNRRTGELREVNPYPRMFSGEPSSALVERWQWTFPIIFSPADPTVLYTSSQHVWKTTNGGQSWDKISADLTRHDPKTLGPSGGPITRDMNEPGGLRDGLRARARQEGRQHPLGRIGRRPRARDARRRQDLDERDAEGDAGLRPRQPDRRVGVRAGRRLRRGQEAAARRPRALHLPHARLRQDVDEDRHRHSRHRLRARRPRGSNAAWPALRRHAARRLRLVRRRRSLAVAVAEPARTSGLGPLRRRQLDRDRDARPRLLHPRRHRAAAARGARRRPTRGRVCSFKPADAIRGGGRRDDHVPAAKAGGEADDRDPRREGPGRADHSGRAARRPRRARSWTR